MTSFPIAPKRPKEITRHGQTHVDNYFWMSHKEDPEVRNYLRAEQDYLEEITQHTKPLQETLFLEMRGRIKEEDEVALEKDCGVEWVRDGKSIFHVPLNPTQ